MAVPAGLEPAISDVTGRHSNQLNYDTINMAKLNLYPAALPTELPSRNITTNIIIILAGREGWIRTIDTQVPWKFEISFGSNYLIFSGPD